MLGHHPVPVVSAETLLRTLIKGSEAARPEETVRAAESEETISANRGFLGLSFKLLHEASSIP